MIDSERMQANHDEFVDLLRSIKREGADIERLINKLEHSDFFTAPASAKFHGAFEGGLVEHCLNVYYNLMHLVKYKDPVLQNPIDEESIIIVSLLHDISKMNLYEKTVRSKKVYDENGNSKDELGRFDWISEWGWKRKDARDTFVYGNHEMNSEFMIRQFIPLTVEESSAILHHMGSMSYDSAKDDIGVVFGKYPLAMLLYLADMLSTYADENVIE